MKPYLPAALARTFCPATLALALSCGLAVVPCRLAAAETTNAALPASQTSPPTKLVVPPEWTGRVVAPPQDYNYEGQTLTEVTVHLQEQCKHQFDVLMPESIALHSATGDALDPGALQIKLRLKNANVIEVFQALNLLFEIDHTPARWELVMNGRRPVAVLHTLKIEPPPPVPAGGTSAGTRPQAVSRSVIFVGDLLGGTGGHAMKPDELCRVLAQTANDTLGASETRKIQFHAGAELLVLSGTEEDLSFMKDVLQAITEKVNSQRKQEPAAPPDAPAKP